jgi:arsenate reductase-like glutaredoxin family protein
MKTVTKQQLLEWIKNFYGNDWRFIMSEEAEQDRRLPANEGDVDKMLREKYQTKDDLIDCILNLSDEGQKYLEENRLV